MPSYKDKDRGTWYCSFYYSDWIGNKKKKKKEGFKTQKEAKTFEREFLERSQGSPDMTFGNLVQLYMEDCKSRLKPTTYAGKKFLINTKLLPYFKDMPINKIEASTIRKWQNELLDHEKKYSQTYLKTVHNQVSAIFNFACKYYKLPSNPARICGAMGKKNADSMKFWTKEEFKQFIPFIADKQISKVIFELLFWTGMRSGELLALTLVDFNFENKTVSISKNYARHEREDLILEPKTPKSKRIITIPDFICDMIKDYVSKLYDYEPHERLFPVTKSYLHSEMNRGSKKAKVKRIRVHDLRHSHASLLIEMGFSPLLISERLGHENIETTLQTYSHLYPNKHGEVADRLEVINGKIDTTETPENNE
ncbi:site-specific integrase [Fusibacter tunisiensis]|uniref:Integrase n=1 Tax=Fusibacter tunisiensis TaxID=1008308 RepID=A0ABS2MSY0_9FIRM|nr:site-specific integrase [Fusibacter tunisiensis]MBM7562524.1 integrase [Fusibacter tunisiensis]